MVAGLIFWIAAALVCYAFAGYPLVLLALRIFIRRPVHKGPIRPLVSLLIPAYNEARVIARKIENSLALHYPPDRIEIVIVSDGSTDDTITIAESTGAVRVLALPANRGKIAALNWAVPQLRGEIIVFSDASAILPPDALVPLIENFADPGVGSVCGRYRTVKADEVNIGTPEDLYWRYEAFIKTQESRLSSTVGAHGHLHAIRKDLYPAINVETINDDYVISISVLSRGFRAVHESNAVVFEEAREMTGFGRRIRIMAGNLQQLRYLRTLLKPLQPLPLFFFLSHKMVRLAVPFAMLAALCANLFLMEARPYGMMLVAQIVFYALAAIGITGQLRPRILRLPYYFCMVNSAAFFGLYHAMTRRRSMAWK